MKDAMKNLRIPPSDKTKQAAIKQYLALVISDPCCKPPTKPTNQKPV